MRYILTYAAAAFALSQATTLAAECNILDRDIFISQGKSEPVLLANGKSDSDPGIILFKSGLRVNTDGAPNSYHPTDLQGKTIAINNICNGVSVKDLSTGKKVSCSKARTVFAHFRDNDWKPPSGFRIAWQSVLAAREENGRTIPCVFRTGDFKGYFGSLTSLKNGLSGADAGECQVKNQLDQRFVPALVLAGGNNVLKAFGARKGDLVLAHNPANGVTKAAVIGDFGPPDNIGEGSVGLNMSLLKKTDQPKTYDEAKKLDTGSHEILVAIIPKSASFELKRPYGADNLTERVESWAKANGYADTAGLQSLMRTCEPFL